MSFGKNIRNARIAGGLTQQALGEAIGVVSQTVSKWERDESLPDAELLPELAELLNVSIDLLFDRVPGKEEAEETIKRRLMAMTDAERTESILRFQRLAMEESLGIRKERDSFPTPGPDAAACYFSIQDAGLLLWSNVPGSTYGCVFERPEEGWARLFSGPDRLSRLWQALSDSEVRRAVLFILSRPLRLVEREALISVLDLERPDETISHLAELGLLGFSDFTVDGRPTRLITIHPDPRVMALLMLSGCLFGGEEQASETAMLVSGGGWGTQPPLDMEDRL
jgi:transcriptional regulator with XRE-family HTH domain